MHQTATEDHNRSTQPKLDATPQTYKISLNHTVQSRATKRTPEMGETAIQPQPAQTADLSISGLRLVAPPCIRASLLMLLELVIS